MDIITKSTTQTFNILNERLSKKERVFFTRFGDGEIVAMMGKDHRNYNNSPGLVRELKESFAINNPGYLIALAVNHPYEKHMAPGVFAPYTRNDEMVKFLEENQLHAAGEYENWSMFQYYSIFYPGKMMDFFERHIRPKKKMFIGSTTKEAAEKLYGKIDYYVPIPPKHAYDSIEEWWPSVEKDAANVELVIPSAGAASNVISKRLWAMNLDIDLIDVGSVIDATMEKRSRIWLRILGHRVKKVLPEEYRNDIYTNKMLNMINEFKYYFRRYIKKYIKRYIN